MMLEPVIGLEVHVQLKTDSKLFCSCPTVFGAEPNSQVCPICTGQPGVLPVLNKKAVELLVRAGLALGCEISPHSIFARKQYFYPDLPKAYQISQSDLPLARGGKVNVPDGKGGGRSIRIHRIHLEEDAGKLLHAIGARELPYSLVDLNRAGIPLAECVSEPEIANPEEAYSYLTELKAVFQYLEISDCDMEKGSLRCDANISLRPMGHKTLGTKAEIKNLNSFKAVKEALHHEIKRQAEVLSTQGRVVQETRLWDEAQGVTRSMRSKEEAHDYRYFPEPDLVPIELPKSLLEAVRAGLPELPAAKRARFVTDYRLSDYDASVLISDKSLAAYFEQAVQQAGAEAAKPVCNWMTNELLGRLNAAKKTIAETPVTAPQLGKLVGLIQKGTITGKAAKDVFTEMFETQGDPEAIIKSKGLDQAVDESAVARWCDEAIAEMPKAVAEYKGGKERAIGSLVGLVMKKSQGKANPQTVTQLLQQKLASVKT
jgi:aspartyl-tRNA(Asn)/glutamyl-tRNA(Gln) amidotransferase subunit B